MNKHLDPIKADIAQAIKDAHSPAIIKSIKTAVSNSVKTNPAIEAEFTQFGKDRVSAAVDKALGHLADRAVMANPTPSTSGSHAKLVHGILLGAIEEKAQGSRSVVKGVVFNPVDRQVYYIDPKYIALEDAVADQQLDAETKVFSTTTDALSEAGWKLVATDDNITNPEGFIDCWEAPGSTSKYKIFINVMQLVQGELQRKGFFLGVQIESAEYTRKLLTKLKEVGVSTMDQGGISDLRGSWRNVIENIPIQLSITSLIRLEDFLFKFDLTDIADCGKILRYYAYDMATNNHTGVSVKSITMNTALFTTVDQLREDGLKKETAENVAPELEGHRVNFEAYKTKLVSFLCEHGFEVVQAAGGNFVFYDNALYKALIDHILSPALVIKKDEPRRISYYQHKIFLGYMALPPFFIDINDEMVMPADSYTSYLNTSKGMGKLNSPESGLQNRSQDAWIALEAAMINIAKNRGDFSPRDIIWLLSIALE